MNKMILIVLLISTFSLHAQETRHEVVHATSNPADNTRPNSDRVPDVYALDAHLERVVVLRFKFGADLLAGLQKMIEQEKIRNAVILSGFGSVRNYQVHQVSNRDMPPKDLFVKNPSAPADIIGMSGVVLGGASTRTSCWPTRTRPSEATWSPIPRSSPLRWSRWGCSMTKWT